MPLCCSCHTSLALLERSVLSEPLVFSVAVQVPVQEMPRADAKTVPPATLAFFLDGLWGSWEEKNTYGLKRATKDWSRILTAELGFQRPLELIEDQ